MSDRFHFRPAAVLSTLLATAALLSLSIPAGAQSKAGDFEAGFDIGSVRFDSAVKGRDREQLHGGVRGGWFLTDSFELEGQISRSNAPLDATLDAAFVNAVWSFRPAARISPYVLVGAGAAQLDEDALFEERSRHDGSAYHAAIGGRFSFGDGRLAARIELSRIVEETLDDAHHHDILTGGLTWRFGR